MSTQVVHDHSLLYTIDTQCVYVATRGVLGLCDKRKLYLDNSR